MEYRISETGEVLTELAFRAAHPNVSFPVPLKAADAAEFGADEVIETKAPAVNDAQYALRDGVELVDGKWRTKWAVLDKSAEQLQEEVRLRVPYAVSMRQARLALLGAGLLNSVAAAINALPSPQKEAAQIEWEYSQEVQRNKELVKVLGPALGLSDAQLDSLFIAAAAL